MHELGQHENINYAMSECVNCLNGVIECEQTNQPSLTALNTPLNGRREMTHCGTDIGANGVLIKPGVTVSE